MEKAVDLNDLLIKHPAATFFLRARGDSMEAAGIRDGATLIVDRALTPVDGDVVIGIVDGNLAVKRLRRDKTGAWLESANPRYRPIPLTADDMIWGVVTDSINPMRQRP
jgi:DNA polymerase V